MCDYDVIISTGSKSVGEIKAESRYRQFDVIMIDYLQLIKAERKYSNRSSEVGDISKALKALAMELNVPVIALSQLNRVSEGRDTKEPTMSELRESGDIEQDASNIFFLWNLDESGEYKGLKVAKQRQGELMKEALQFIGENMKFVEIEKPLDDVVAEIKRKNVGTDSSHTMATVHFRGSGYGKCKNRKRFGRMASIYGLLAIHSEILFTGQH